MKTVLLGEAPARGMDNQPPFSSGSGQRLSEILGQDVREVFECLNILDKWPGSQSRGSEFPLSEAIERFQLSLVFDELWKISRRVLVAGRRAAAAVSSDLVLTDYFKPWQANKERSPKMLRSHTFIVIPHLSGVNRWWNNFANAERARTFLIAEAERDLVS